MGRLSLARLNAQSHRGYVFEPSLKSWTSNSKDAWLNLETHRASLGRPCPWHWGFISLCFACSYGWPIALGGLRFGNIGSCRRQETTGTRLWVAHQKLIHCLGEQWEIWTNKQHCFALRVFIFHALSFNRSAELTGVNLYDILYIIIYDSRDQLLSR